MLSFRWTQTRIGSNPVDCEPLVELVLEGSYPVGFAPRAERFTGSTAYPIVLSPEVRLVSLLSKLSEPYQADWVLTGPRRDKLPPLQQASLHKPAVVYVSLRRQPRRR